MASYEERVGEPRAIDKDYVEIIRSDVQKDPTYVSETGVPAKIVYFCPACKKLIAPKRVGKKFLFSCAECKANPVAFGTENSIANYFRTSGVKPAKKTLE